MTTVQHQTRSYVLQPGHGRAIPVPHAGGLVTMKAETHQTGGLITLYESRHEPRSVGPARHFHEGMTELFYILERTFTFLVGEEIHRAPAGTTVVVPPRTVHAFHNAEDEPARLLVMVLPGGFEGFFDAARELESPATDMARWHKVNDAWDQHVVGPPLGHRKP
ncbi:MAG: cupin domain-containing protein [Chloroflexi bacterium]|nr:cupin domain-containing protein [Chloroflexota bacterium]